MGRPRHAGQQRRRRGRRAARRRHDGRVGVDHEHQPVRRGPRDPHVRPVFKRQRSGHIVNIASLAGLVHPAGMASYNAVKAAVVALTETTGHELAGYGVRASVVCPSYFRTNLMSSLRGADEALSGVVAHLVRVLADHRGRHRRRRPRGARPRGRAHRAGPAGARRVRAQAGRPGGVRRRHARPGSQARQGDVMVSTGSTRPTRTGTRPSRSATRTRSTSRRSRAGCASTPRSRRAGPSTTWPGRRRCVSSAAAPRT